MEHDIINNKVRLIKFEELNELLDLYQYLNHDDPNLKGSDNINKLWDKIFNDPNRYYFVVEDDGVIVSSCTLIIIDNLTRSGRPFGLIENVVTHKEYRKRGYGTAVLHKALEVAKNKDCYKIVLLTGRKEESVLRFYERVGFEKGIKTGFIIRF
jgi:GNAT superfamily N-acetyltransferase